MVRSNQIVSEPSDSKLAPQGSLVSALNTDAIPLLGDDTEQPIRTQNSFPKRKKKTNRRKKSAEPEEEETDASAASLQLILEEYEPPDDQAAKLAHVKTHYHHELFSLSDTKTDDLAEFGQGLALYFYFLKWIAMLLAAMSVVVLPNMVWSIMARHSGTSTTGIQISSCVQAYGQQPRLHFSICMVLMHQPCCHTRQQQMHSTLCTTGMTVVAVKVLTIQTGNKHFARQVSV